MQDQQFAKNWDFKMKTDKERQFEKGFLSKKRTVLLKEDSRPG